MSAAAIAALERALQCTDIAMMTLEINSALGSLRQQPSVLNDLTLHAKLEAFVAKYDTASQAAAAIGIPKQTLSAARQGTISYPPAICRALGVKKLPPGRTLYREV